MSLIKGSLIKGDIIHLNPDTLEIISKEEADKIANSYPQHQFVITSVGGEKFKSFTDYVKKQKR